MDSSAHGNWSELPFPPPGDLPNSGTEPMSLTSPPLQADSLPLCHLSRGLSQNFIPTVPQCLLGWTTHEGSLTAYFTELECVCVCVCARACVCVGKVHKYTQDKPTISNKKTKLTVKARRTAHPTSGWHTCVAQRPLLITDNTVTHSGVPVKFSVATSNSLRARPFVFSGTSMSYYLWHGRLHPPLAINP